MSGCGGDGRARAAAAHARLAEAAGVTPGMGEAERAARIEVEAFGALLREGMEVPGAPVVCPLCIFTGEENIRACRHDGPGFDDAEGRAMAEGRADVAADGECG